MSCPRFYQGYKDERDSVPDLQSGFRLKSPKLSALQTRPNHCYQAESIEDLECSGKKKTNFKNNSLYADS